MSELGTILKAIEGVRSDVREDNMAVWKAIEEGRKCQTRLKLESQENRNEIKGMGKDIQTIVKSLGHHIKSKTEHYKKDIADEGVWSYAWRKKLQITITSIIVTIITVSGGILIQYLQTILIGG